MMNDQLSLICPPVRTSFFPDENPISYLVRLAELNRYPSYRWLLAGKGAGTIDYQLLYETLLATEWFGYKFYNPRTQEICELPNIHINSSRLRYCPLCLQEVAYWRIGWQIKFSVVCTRHQVWLHDLCPHCSEEQSILKVDEKHSTCLEYLPGAATDSAPLTVILMQHFLETGLVNQDFPLIDDQEQISILERCELIAFMMKWQGLGENQANPTRQKFEYVHDFKDKAVQSAEALFTDQGGFWRYLQSMHLLSANYIGIQQKRLVYFYREFFKLFPSASFKPLSDLVESYATKNLIRDITNKHTLFSSNARKVQLWYSFTKACKEYRIDSSVLNRAITDKQITAHFEGDGEYTKCSIYRPDLEKILPHLRGLIPATDAAEMLGVTKAQFNQLQNCGCFKFEVAPRQDYCSTWQYSQHEIETILENLNLGAASITSESLTISQIMQHHIRGTVEMPFLQVFKAIVAGQLIVRKMGSETLKIRALSIEREEFMQWLDNLRPAPGYMSVTAAAKLLGVNEEFAYQLVRRGYLQHKVDSRKAKVIFPDHIRQFNQEYVILSKLLEKTRLSSASTVKMLKHYEIYPVDHNRKTKLRQKLYLRADIMKTKWFYRFVKYLPE